MESLSTSLLLLLVALVLLWLAVTDKLSRVLDAWDVITGKTDANSVATTTQAVLSIPAFHLPALPAFGNNAQVPA